MANAHAASFKKIPGCKVSAICEVNKKNAADFLAHQKLNVPCYQDFAELLANEEIDAISNVTPDAFHAPLSLQAIAAGKHVLCEKPLATCYADAKKMATAAKRKGVINMVNLSYRNSSAIHRAHDLIAAGKIGQVKHVDAAYLQSWLVSKAWGNWRTGKNWLWRLSTRHGSAGVLGDIGVHIVDFASYPAGQIKKVHCKLQNFKKAPGNKIGEYKLDTNDSAVITAEFAGGAIGTIHLSRYTTGYHNCLQLRVFGDKGAIRIDLDKSKTELEICAGKDRHSAKWRTIKCRKTPSIYQRFIQSIKTGKNDQPDFARGAEIQKVLDACIQSDKMDKTIKV